MKNSRKTGWVRNSPKMFDLYILLIVLIIGESNLFVDTIYYGFGLVNFSLLSLLFIISFLSLWFLKLSLFDFQYKFDDKGITIRKRNGKLIHVAWLGSKIELERHVTWSGSKIDVQKSSIKIFPEGKFWGFSIRAKIPILRKIVHLHRTATKVT